MEKPDVTAAEPRIVPVLPARWYASIAAALALVCSVGCGSSGSGAGTAGAANTGGSAGTTGSGGSTATGGAKGTGGSTAGTGGTTTQGAWELATNNLQTASGTCAPAAFITAKPDEDMLIADLWQKGLWSSKDGGATWSALGTGAGSATVANGTVTIVWDPDHAATFWESGMYGPAAYATTDDGVTFTGLGDIQHVDVMSVDFSDPARKTLLAGAHETARKLYKSTDGGATWNDIGPNLPAGTSFSSYPLIIDTQTYLEGCSGWDSGATGIFRSTDAGATWTKVNSQGAQTRPLVASDGAIYWPIIYNRGLLKSTDKGVTWSQVVSQWNTLTTFTPVELPDKRLASISGNGNNTPAFMAISADGGKTWKHFGPKIPIDPRAFTYSSFQKAFYVSYDDCKSGAKNAVMKLAFDYQSQ